MSISIAEIKDVPQLTALVNSAYRGESSKKGWTNESHLLDGTRINEATFCEYFFNPSISILKYTNSDNQIIGCVHLQQKDSSLYLGMLTVNPQSQKSGIGNALIQAAEAQAKRLNCTTITMSVISVRHELIAYYKRKGYIETGEIFPFPAEHEQFGKPKQPLQLLTMEKKMVL